MTKKDQISFYKKQMDSAIKMKSVAKQNLHLATQIESEAKRALELLGNSPERTRKGNDVLSEEVKIHLIGNLTKGSEQSA